MLDQNTKHEDTDSIIESAKQFSVGKLLAPERGDIFSIPLYQREYIWQRKHLASLFDDIYDNHEGYFIGPIICVQQGYRELELIDGQQRMTTLSLLFAAMYFKLDEMRRYNETLCGEYMEKLKQMLVFDSGTDDEKARLVPQIQNSNKQDYYAVLRECGLRFRANESSRSGLRRISKTYNYFQGRLAKMIREKKEVENKIGVIIEFLEKVLKANLIVIEVKNLADGYTLFDSLNNRGEPLNHIDIIKNNLLSELNRKSPNNIQSYFNDWMQLLELLNKDYTIKERFRMQERFTRHYYNARMKDLQDVAKAKFAMHTNRVRIYERLIKHDAGKLLVDLLVSGKHYNRFFDYDNSRHVDMPPDLKKALRDLERIKGVASYILLLHLYINRDKLQISDNHMTDIVNSLVKFYVRRNLLDFPALKYTDSMFMGIIEEISSFKGDEVVKIIKRELFSKSSHIDNFYRRLTEEAMYEINRDATRFVLCALEESRMTRETKRDLWCREGKNSVFTIEHIFPQGANIGEHWINMMAGGNERIADIYRYQYAHTLGNLTLTAFNSRLSNDDFLTKRDKRDENGFFIGYKNGFWLNEDLAEAEGWSVEKIKARGDKLANECLKLFALDESELQEDG